MLQVRLHALLKFLTFFSPSVAAKSVSLIVYPSACLKLEDLYIVVKQCNRSACMHTMWYWSSNCNGSKKLFCYCSV